MRFPLPTCLAALVLLFHATSAHAQWTRVADVPVSTIYSAWANGDTIAAGSDSSAYVSVDGGLTWKHTADVASGISAVSAVRLRNGRLYAGTSGKGVFVSDDLGDTWIAFNQGLTGGLFNSQLFISDLLLDGDRMLAATSGAGAYARDLTAGNWAHFGEEFEPNQSSNLNDVAAGGSRLVACGGFNGTVFWRDPGDPDWTLSWLEERGITPGLAALTAAWNGFGWVVGSNIGVYRSVTGQGPWTLGGPNLGTLLFTSFATRGRDLFAAFQSGSNAVVSISADDGATWRELETLPFTFVFEIARSGSVLYAGRADGLWRRSIADVSVPSEPRAPGRFALAGAQPVRGAARFRFALETSGDVRIDVFDAAGRRVATVTHGAYGAGAHALDWDAHALAPGVYEARFLTRDRVETTRLVRVR